MLQYEKITNDEGIDPIKIQIFQEFAMFVGGFFVSKNSNYEDYACNGCHNLLMMAFSLDNITVLNVDNVFY